MVWAEVEKEPAHGKNRQVPGQSHLPYKPQLHMTGWLRQGHPRIHALSNAVPNQVAIINNSSCTKAKRKQTSFYLQICQDIITSGKG